MVSMPVLLLVLVLALQSEHMVIKEQTGHKTTPFMS